MSNPNKSDLADATRYAMSKQLPALDSGFSIATTFGDLYIEADEAQRHPAIREAIRDVLTARLGTNGIPREQTGDLSRDRAGLKGERDESYSMLVFADRAMLVSFNDAAEGPDEYRAHAMELCRAALGTARAMKQLHIAQDAAASHGPIFEQDLRDLGTANEFLLATASELLERADAIELVECERADGVSE